MKRMNQFTGLGVALLLAVVSVTGMHCSGSTYAQESDKSINIKQAVASQHYIFKARTVMPMQGRTRQLTTDYDIRVTTDSVVAFLPYFGRAYSAPIDPTKGGIQFTSTDFKYQLTQSGDGWDIRIDPEDVRDVQYMRLRIFDNGTATLNVTSTNRQPISFNGDIITSP